MKVTQEFKINKGQRKVAKNLYARLPELVITEIENLIAKNEIRELRKFLCNQVGLSSINNSFLVTKEKLGLSQCSDLMQILDSENPIFSLEIKKRGCFISYFITCQKS